MAKVTVQVRIVDGWSDRPAEFERTTTVLPDWAKDPGRVVLTIEAMAGELLREVRETAAGVQLTIEAERERSTVD